MCTKTSWSEKLVEWHGAMWATLPPGRCREGHVLDAMGVQAFPLEGEALPLPSSNLKNTWV